MIPYLHEKLYCKTIVVQKKKHKCITSVDCAWRELLICMCVSARKVGRKKCFWISGANVARQKGNPQWQLNNLCLWYNIYNLYICQKRCPEASLWMLMIVYATIPCNMYMIFHSIVIHFQWESRRWHTTEWYMLNIWSWWCAPTLKIDRAPSATNP